MSERERRLARNENLFREVNERIREVGEEFDVALAQTAHFVCECDDPVCTESVQVKGVEYERIRANPIWFVVVKGHEDPSVEFVAEETDRYNVVQKTEGDGADVARATDPRS
jgi:hypothetical protein